MNPYKWVYVGYAMAWLATGISVATAVYITKSATPLWALLIPGSISFKVKNDE